MGPAAPSIGREGLSRAPFEFTGRPDAFFAAGARDLAELFRALYYETARVMDATVFLFAVYDEAAKTVQVVRQMDRGVEHPGGSFPLGSGFTSEVIRSGAPKLIRHWATDGPPVRITTPHIPLPAADALEDAVLPTVERIAETVRRSLQS